MDCFYVCLVGANLLLPLVTLTALTVALFIAFRVERGFRPFLGAQATMTAVISMSLVSMDCYMSTWLWAYLGLVTGGTILMLVARRAACGRVEREVLGTFPALAAVEEEFDVSIRVLDTQRVRALAHRDIVYLSVGLLELLDDDQLRAVVAHEVYHLRNDHPRLLGHMMALASLTFLRYEDERAADSFAASVTGVEAITSALEVLGIRGREARSAALS